MAKTKTKQVVTQKQRALNLLQKGKGLTFDKAKTAGINNLYDSVYKLRRQGWNIESTKRTTRNGTVTVYQLGM